MVEDKEVRKYFKSMDALFDGRTNAFSSANPKERPTPLFDFREGYR